MKTDLTITDEQIQAGVPVMVFHLHGWLDGQSEEQLLARANEEFQKGSRFLLLDLAELATLTSAGMRAIQKVYKLYTPPEEHFKVAHVKLCNAPPQIYHVLGITGFLQNLPMYESLQAALDSFEAP
ncbi:MAG TPA: STAS domain-containing protein [Anaerolineales bacterium]|nr:STAS domain-containing protein [Anaerolineales bacterium]